MYHDKVSKKICQKFGSSENILALKNKIYLVPIHFEKKNILFNEYLNSFNFFFISIASIVMLEIILGAKICKTYMSRCISEHL